MIGDLAGAAGGLSAGELTSGSKAQAKLAENFDTFLILLTTQLRNQDPLDPMDSAQFTQQLVQFSQVEQAILSNQNLETLIADVRMGQNASLLGYLGRDIEALGKTAMLTEDGARWNYHLPVSATQSDYTVLDSDGRAVAFGRAERTAGLHAFPWDGLNSAGQKLPDGPYTLVVTARDRDDNPIAVTTTVTGRVTAIETGEGRSFLATGEVLFDIDEILGVKTPGNPI